MPKPININELHNPTDNAFFFNYVYGYLKIFMLQPLLSGTGIADQLTGMIVPHHWNTHSVMWPVSRSSSKASKYFCICTNISVGDAPELSSPESCFKVF